MVYKIMVQAVKDRLVLAWITKKHVHERSTFYINTGCGCQHRAKFALAFHLYSF